MNVTESSSTATGREHVALYRRLVAAISFQLVVILFSLTQDMLLMETNLLE
jgi:hypothetical protein